MASAFYMKINELKLPLIAIVLCFQPVYAAECQPNGLGGTFCVNNDGTTSDSIPNDVGGMDTYSSGGELTSSVPDNDGSDQVLGTDLTGESAPKINDDLKSTKSKYGNEMAEVSGELK